MLPKFQHKKTIDVTLTFLHFKVAFQRWGKTHKKPNWSRKGDGKIERLMCLKGVHFFKLRKANYLSLHFKCMQFRMDILQNCAQTFVP